MEVLLGEGEGAEGIGDEGGTEGEGEGDGDKRSIRFERGRVAVVSEETGDVEVPLSGKG